jgi:hypothetical protein
VTLPTLGRTRGKLRLSNGTSLAKPVHPGVWLVSIAQRPRPTNTDPRLTLAHHLLGQRQTLFANDHFYGDLIAFAFRTRQTAEGTRFERKPHEGIALWVNHSAEDELETDRITPQTRTHRAQTHEDNNFSMSPFLMFAAVWPAVRWAAHPHSHPERRRTIGQP